jgi:glycosyltransferase involved in cell wall biosynthesis
MNFSIVIPTYTPNHYLIETINSINVAAINLGQTFPVYICINGAVSNNGTTQQLLKLSQSHLNLTFVSSIADNTPRESLNFAISQASEEYVWIMSDDDLLEETSLQKISKVLEIKNLQVAVANFSTIDAKGTTLISNVQGWVDDRTYQADEIGLSIIDMNFCYGTFSSLIVKREAWFMTKYLTKQAPGGMNFLLQVPELMTKGPHYIIADPIYKYRLYKKKWQKNYNQTFILDHINLPSIIQSYKKLGINNRAITALTRKNFRGILQSFYSLKLNGNITFKLLILTFKTNYTNVYFYFGLILIIIPGSILKEIKKIQMFKKFKTRL